VAYEIVFSQEADKHLDALAARHRARVFAAVERQLREEPAVATRNRKPMDPEKRMFIAPWELRVGELRVYYSVEQEPRRKVVIVAVGIKVRERVWIGGEEIEP
jgi:mRNA-degrading endonuclease RelE of RelBE toxin-antitoxin system